LAPKKPTSKNSSKTSLEALRAEIDSVDDQILELLSTRGDLAIQIGQLKQKDGKNILVPSREKSILDRLASQNKGPYSKEAIWTIFREMISATRALEAPIKVAYLGPEATFTHMAAVKHFGSSASLKPVSGIETIFHEVEKGHTDYGVVPIENSTEGVVSHTLDMFADSPLKVCAEVVLPVAHHLLSNETNLNAIKTVYSHPQALAQCRQWLLSHLPQAILKETSSTSEAARLASQTKASAAIASEIAASTYGLTILQRAVQDQSRNYTRFLVIGSHMSGKTGDDKTSILFTIKDEVGALFKILSYFADQKVNLSKIESRPLKKKAWEYIFFVDLDGHVTDKPIAKALDLVQKKCVLFNILGSYPKDTTRIK